ncbi:MAG: cytochrome B5 [bacterium]|nr:cytochrome B5 [bacterium]
MRKFLDLLFLTVILLISLETNTFAGYLDNLFDIQKFSGNERLISTKTLEQTSGWVSVEGVVYNLGDTKLKKYLKLSEIDSKLLTKDKFIGYLAITHSELEKMNSKNAPTMVAVNGIVYDLSNSRSWIGGVHKNRHNAGQNLTYDILKLSPHGIGMIKRFPSYGVLVFTPQELSKFNGKGTKGYVSVYGIVYDATYSNRFQGGEHFGHSLGLDLTSEILLQQGHTNLLSRLFSIGLLVFDANSIRAFNGKNSKPFVIVDRKVYDVSKRPQGVTPGTVTNVQVDSEWLLVGFRLE